MKAEILAAAKADAIPAGESGLWKIHKMTCHKALSIPAHMGGHSLELPPGIYTSLFRVTMATMHGYGELVMHDFPAEIDTHLGFALAARGQVLITGLGLGCVTRMCLANPNVKHVTVIENSPHVINLVYPHMPAMERLTVIPADATQWVKKTKRKFDCAWHDLWTDEAAGEPHLQTVHMKLICDLAGRVPMQGAWKFPREFRRQMKKWAGVI